MLPRRRPRGSLHDGISLNFATGRHYAKAQGGPANISPLTSLFTFTSGNQSMYRGPAGLLVASATNTPRIEYDVNGNCLGLLMEAARTNLCLQSQDFATTWTVVNATISTNTTAAPDGTTTADTIVEDGTTAQHRSVSGNVSGLTAATVYTASIFVKASGRTRGRLSFIDSADTDGVFAYFDLGAGTITSSGVFGAGTLSSSSITLSANGFYRISVSGAMNNAKTTGRIFLNTSTADGSVSHAGSNANALILWGAQLEAGAFPSSYIPTTTGSVARTADSCIRTLGSEFSATAGTVVVAGRASGGQDAANNQFVYEFSDDTSNERDILFRPSAGDNARFNIIDGGVGQGPINDTFVNSTAFKHAAAFAANDMAVSFNGATVQTDATVTLPTVTKLYLGSTTLSALQMNGHILRFDYYPTRLPNTYLVSASA